MNLDLDALYQLARAQAAAWTLIDSVCVALVLLTLDLVRARERRGRGWLRWSLLAWSLALFPLVIAAPDRRAFFRSEVIVVGLHFSALLLCLADIPAVLRFIARLEQRTPGFSDQPISVVPQS